MKSTRRLVGGILQIVFGAIVVLISLGVFFRTAFDAQRGEAVFLFLYSALSLGIGIFFVSTYKKRPVKKVEYTLVAILIALAVLVQLDARFINGTDFFIVLLLICYVVGAPNNQGYKNLPFVSKK